jgi:hypothetical protein
VNRREFFLAVTATVMPESLAARRYHVGNPELLTTAGQVRIDNNLWHAGRIYDS